MENDEYEDGREIDGEEGNDVEFIQGDEDHEGEVDEQDYSRILGSMVLSHSTLHPMGQHRDGGRPSAFCYILTQNAMAPSLQGVQARWRAREQQQ